MNDVPIALRLFYARFTYAIILQEPRLVIRHKIPVDDVFTL